jgi:hypothetical protein
LRFSRFILFFLLIYQALFLNVLLPGHTRGAITIDGKHTTDACPCCCCCGGDKAATANPDFGMPSKRDREHCAFCEFAVGLISIPIVKFTLPEFGLLDVLPIAPPRVVISLDRISTYFACGPPLSVATF